ncbi:DUF3526 domain-containing protein [Chitinophaga pinensis]|uniref:DUF3526 domain-containing protein n=1 Tax=Chitinophaga pinensis (strain ATCC 43595 / DSM 2588 / LMG 13176 / NBRC 15968 / NCIMB 11800 / UQM 2034) TaxID=485918 RepID=A0A979G871_CHIPD|nr:DUF3526 domain-containing protein [Chitinophaga pinensis]ACU62754.1 hypothetical protein Cpin_5323 [Chitinophaga pinensis DSM 2588]
MLVLNNKINSWKQIIRFELHTLLRTGTLPALLLIILSAGTAAVLFGHHIRVHQLNTLDSIRIDYSIQYDKLYKGLSADTSTPEGKAAYISASHPAVIDYRLHKTVAHPPAAFSGLSVGMSDMTRYYVPVTVKETYVPVEEKINNPLHLLTGNFDVSFLIIYLLPLALICTSYNLLAQEKEQGTLSLLIIQKGGIADLLFLRLLIRYAVVLCCVLLLTLLSITLTQTASFADTLSWLLISAAYLAVWTGIIWLLLSWNAGTAVSLITMLCAWMFLLVVLPSLFNFRLNHADTDENTAILASLQREIEWDTWDMPQQQVLDSFYAVYPVYRNSQAYDTSASSTRRMMAYYDLVSRRMQRLTAQATINRIQGIQQINHSYQYNPAVYTQALLNSVAHTDIADYAYFQQQTALFRQQWKSFLYYYHFNDKKFSADDYRILPVYHPSYRPDSRKLQLQGVCHLLLLAGGLLLTGTFLLRKNHTGHRI